MAHRGGKPRLHLTGQIGLATGDDELLVHVLDAIGGFLQRLERPVELCSPRLRLPEGALRLGPTAERPRDACREGVSSQLESPQRQSAEQQKTRRALTTARHKIKSMPTSEDAACTREHSDECRRPTAQCSVSQDDGEDPKGDSVRVRVGGHDEHIGGDGTCQEHPRRGHALALS